MKIVVGLGNPGAEYLKTRHNVGFLVVEELARRHALGGESPKSKFEAEVLDISMPGPDGNPEKVLLAEPQTFMNLSGRSVGRMVDFYRVEHADVLVLCDDMNLPSGKLRLRGSGSAGGQNGLANIIQVLGGQDFPRLRIGIGRPPGRMSASAYVLGKFTKDETEGIEHAIVTAADGVERWVRDGLDRAMNFVNAAE